jgi:hypothetical protein
VFDINTVAKSKDKIKIAVYQHFGVGDVALAVE